MKETLNYKLKKPEHNDIVNVDDFNYNADVMDKELKRIDNKTSNITAETIKLSDGKTVEEKFKEHSTQVAELEQDLDEHKAESATQAHLARNIELEDTAGNFVATNIEGAMSELFTNVSDGKSLVGGAITDVDDSVVIPTDPTFQELADGIGQISTGKKWAKGSSNVSFSGKSVIVNNLTFRPRNIFARYNTGSESTIFSYSLDNGIPSALFTYYSATVSWTGVISITDTGFHLTDMPISGGSLDNRYFHWIAFE